MWDSGVLDQDSRQVGECSIHALSPETLQTVSRILVSPLKNMYRDRIM